MIKDRDTYFCQATPALPKPALPAWRSYRYLQFRLSSVLVLMVVLGGFFVWLRDYVHTRPIAWTPYSAVALDCHRSEGQVVLLLVDAEWNLTCLYNRKYAIETRKVRRLIREQGVVAMEADWTEMSPDVTALLESMDVRSVPLIAIFPARPGADPIKLHDLVSEIQVLHALRVAQGKRR
jgi:thiol:disulfide interchange protein